MEEAGILKPLFCLSFIHINLYNAFNLLQSNSHFFQYLKNGVVATTNNESRSVDW